MRLTCLKSAPLGLDIDEAAILTWGAQGKFYTFSPEFTRWETLPGYFYALVHWLTGVPRLGPTLLAIAELGALGALTHRLIGVRGAWVAVALLAVSPWHLYYSRIVGTCVGAGLWTLLAILWARRPLLSSLALVLGMLHYTAFRLVFVREGFLALRQRSWPTLGRLGAVLGLTLGIVALSASSVGDFFDRGSYNLLGPQLHWITNSLGTLGIGVLPILPPFQLTSAHFMADYVHGGFTSTLPSWSTPLGWGTSLLLIGGLIRARRSETIRRESLFVGFCLLALAPLGPSYSRILFLVPLFCLTAAYGWAQFPESWKRKPVLIGILGLSLAPALTMGNRLGDAELLEPFFHSRHLALHTYVQEEIADPTPSNTIVISNYGYQSARFWQGQKNNYGLLPLLPVEKMIPHLAFLSEGLPQNLIIENIPPRADTLSGFPKSEPLEDHVRGLLSMAIVERDVPIEVNQKQIGRHLVVRWAFEAR